MSIYRQISVNRWKTSLVMLLFIVFIAFLAYIFGEAIGYGWYFLGVALVISGLTSLGSYYYSDRIILALSHARPADPKRDFDLYTVTENLCIASGLARPKLYVIDDIAANAFATGRGPDHAVVCVTSGLIQKLKRTELEGVIAHELSHIANYDIRLMGMVAILVGTVVLLSDMFMRIIFRSGKRSRRGGSLLFLIGIILAALSPLIATIIKLAISRQREYLADASGVLLTRYPEGLARALEKISQDKEVLKTATNATAHLFIVNPFKGKEFKAWFANLFDTHPPVEERIKILRQV